MTTKSYLLVLLSSFLLLGCNENDGPAVCGVENPMEDLAWIKSFIQENSGSALAEYSYLTQARYQGQTVFFFGSCCPFCNWAFIVQDCQGNALEGDIRMDDLEDQKIIWKPANSVCTFS